MAKTGRRKKGKTPAVLRCDKLATFMNSAKEDQVRAMLRDWRKAAGLYSSLGVRSNVLDLLVNQHVERNTGERGAPADPRLSNPHFAAWTDEARLSAKAALMPNSHEADLGVGERQRPHSQQAPLRWRL